MAELSNETFRTMILSLSRGRYNLLLGSGISLDSTNAAGERVKSAEDLRKELCSTLDVPETTPLSQAAQLLSPEQVERFLTKPYSGCTPGPSLALLPTFLWRRMFTFNIDDVLEALYRGNGAAKQRLGSLNFNSAFDPTPEHECVNLVHLHGTAREPSTGYVFSHTEYARYMREQNHWMHMLSGILATEPFIIAGTSLNEIDLEFYLSQRTAHTPMKDRGPSFLVEPNPNRITRHHCERHGLVLFEGTLEGFLRVLDKGLPSRPTVSDLVLPDRSNLRLASVAPPTLLRFFSDFEFVEGKEEARSALPGPFLGGREPEWSDINQHLDVERRANTRIYEETRRLLNARGRSGPALVMVLDEAGVGKSTTAMRVAHSLAQAGVYVFSIKTNMRIDTRAAIGYLKELDRPFVLLADRLGDHAEQILEIISHSEVSERVVVLGAERNYRSELIDIVFGGVPTINVVLDKLDQTELRELLESYRGFGLVASKQAITDPARFAQVLSGDSVTVAVCRILEDFRALDSIVKELWGETPADARPVYVAAALAHHCHSAGIRFSVLQSASGPLYAVRELLDKGHPLRLAVSPLESDFAIPLNSAVADRLLHSVQRTERGLLLDVFIAIAKSLAPMVNRMAIKLRSPEARLAQRLFDVDKIVRPFLDHMSESFYVAVQSAWEWNSRYWEQRALLAAETDLAIAISHARHAVAIEKHPFTQTTLAKIILKQMEAEQRGKERLFGEAFDLLSDAIESEALHSRTTIHPFTTLFSGAARFLETGGTLTERQAGRLSTYTAEAAYNFRHDRQIDAIIRKLDGLIERG